MTTRFQNPMNADDDEDEDEETRQLEAEIAALEAEAGTEDAEADDAGEGEDPMAAGAETGGVEVEVEVPEGANAGDEVQVEVMGQTVSFTVPEGAAAGDIEVISIIALADTQASAEPPEMDAPSTSNLRAALLGASELKVEGFKLHVFILMVLDMAMPTINAMSDWAVTIGWLWDEQWGWAQAALAIHFVSGTFLGVLLALSLFDTMPKANAYTIGLLVGWAGLTPVYQTATALVYHADHARAQKEAKGVTWFKTGELIAESLPMAILQNYVGVSYGHTDPGSENFDPKLVVSIAVAMACSGMTLFTFEASLRNSEAKTSPVAGEIRILSRYGAATALLRSSQAAAFVFACALLGCAYKGSAWFAVLVGSCTLLGVVLEAAARGREGGGSPAGASTALLSFVALIGILHFVFSSPNHDDNNYDDPRLPVGNSSTPQNFDCHERSSGTIPAMATWIAAMILSAVNVAIDPKFGPFRTPNWAERLEEASKGMTEEEVLDAKIRAIYAKADRIKGDGIGAAEIVALAGKLEVDYAELCQTLGVEQIPINLRSKPLATIIGRLQQQELRQQAAFCVPNIEAFRTICLDDPKRASEWFHKLKLDLRHERHGLEDDAELSEQTGEVLGAVLS